MIKYYYSLADYNAIDKTDFDGRNVVVNIQLARTGAIVMLDQYKTLHFVPYSAYSAAGYANYEKVGVVRIGVDHSSFRGQIAVMNKEFPGKRLTEIYSFRLTSYILDGTQHTGTLSIREASDNYVANHEYVISYAATTEEALVNQLNTYFRGNEPFNTQGWHARKNEDNSIDLVFRYLDWRMASYDKGMDGFVMTANLFPEWIATSNMYRLTGQRSGEGTITNMSRALAYFRNDNSNGTYNPTTDVTSVKRGYPICLPGYLGTSQYQSDHCAFLRGVYGEGEEGWKRFMKSLLPVRPTEYGTIGDKAKYGDARRNTYYLAKQMFTDIDGTEKKACPAADFVASVGYDHELLAKGQWVMPDSDLLFDVVGEIEYGTTNNRDADVINRALKAIGAAGFSNATYVWSCSRCGAGSGWCAGGGGGYAYAAPLYGSYLAVPLMLLDMPQSAI